MIPLLLLIGQVGATSQPTIIEIPNDKENRIVVQAVIQVPEVLGPRSRARLECAVATLSSGTVGYTRHRLIEFAGLSGQGLRIFLNDQFLTIGVSAPKGSIDIATDLISELLQKPLFAESDIQNTLNELPFKRYSSADLVLGDQGFDFNKLTRDEVKNEYENLVIPSNTTVVLSGAFLPGEGKAEFEKRLISWPKLPPKRYEPEQKPVPTRKASTGSSATTVLVGPELPVADLANAVGGAYLLGVGKSSSAFRIVRQKLGMSYQQDANVVLTPKGFRLNFQYSTATNPTSPDDAEKVRTALMEDVKSWTQQDLDRARALWVGPVQSGILPTPVLGTEGRPIRMNLEDQTMWTGLLASHPFFKGVVQSSEATKSLGVGPDLNIDRIKELIGNCLRESSVKIVNGP